MRENEIFDTPGAAKVVKVSESYLEKLRVTGGGPAFLKIGRVVRYRYQDLQDWLADKSRTSTSDVDAANGSEPDSDTNAEAVADGRHDTDDDDERQDTPP